VLFVVKKSHIMRERIQLSALHKSVSLYIILRCRKPGCSGGFGETALPSNAQLFGNDQCNPALPLCALLFAICA